MSEGINIQDLAGLEGLKFTKMTGTGNDFIMLDSREADPPVELRSIMARALCHRRRSVGADGLLIVEHTDRVDEKFGPVDFKWDFYNADGSHAEMCGNAARCTARFAFERGWAEKKMMFDSLAGPIRAWVGQGGDASVVKIAMTPPVGFYQDVRLEACGEEVLIDGVNTGVPHAVIRVGDLEDTDVVGLGRSLRYHEHFAPAGTNANFISLQDEVLSVRTYERGVEDETMACGTGAVASALVAGKRGLVNSPVTVKVRSGETLKVYFDIQQDPVKEVFLEGATSYVYQAVIQREAFAWLAA